MFLKTDTCTARLKAPPKEGSYHPRPPPGQACLSNVFLHHVLDEWYANEVRPRLRGNSMLVRFADDLVMAFETFEDAERVLAVLGKRLARYGLTLHPDQTRFIDFRPQRPEGDQPPGTSGTAFDFLGFIHVWGARKGRTVVRQVTAKNRYARAATTVTDWCKRHRHQPMREQHARLSSMMRGHFAYYGITGNARRLSWYAHQVVRAWKAWLSRRGGKDTFLWSRLDENLRRHPLPPVRIVHRYASVGEALR